MGHDESVTMNTEEESCTKSGFHAWSQSCRHRDAGGTRMMTIRLLGTMEADKPRFHRARTQAGYLSRSIRQKNTTKE
jgi:hypothetical protein